MKIAFLGLGHMGRELVQHLREDHEVVAWNRTPPDPSQYADIRIAGSAEEAVDAAEVVITMLFGPDVVRDLVVSGLLPRLAGKLWIDVTTVSPADAESFARAAEEAGVDYVHAPVMGSTGPARAGKLGVVVGGPADATERAASIVAAWADPDRLRRCGSAAEAARRKLIANVAIGTAIQGLAEAVRLGAEGGLDASTVLDGLAGTPLGTIAGLKAELIGKQAYDDTEFAADLLAKDLRLALRSCERPLPAVTAALESLDGALQDGRGRADFSVIVDG